MKRTVSATRAACYITNISIATVSCLSPLLFVTFQKQFSLSYTLLGTLVLANFCSQLLMDVVFTLFGKKLDSACTVRFTPLLCAFGFLVYAFLPWVAPRYAYLWLMVGTCLFSFASGLSDMLMSPTLSSIPDCDAPKEVSRLHAFYAWGIVGVVLFSALFFLLFGTESWQVLVLLFTIIPLTAFCLFRFAEVPKIAESQQTGNAVSAKTVLPIALCMFLAGATENTMTQWCSGYLETALGLSKFWCDVAGLALFALLMGLGRTWFTHKGKNITRVMTVGFAGAFACYLLASVSSSAVVGLIACVLTGLFVSMLWPGVLILAEKKHPSAGVLMYSLIACGGDLGCSAGPQLTGIVADFFDLRTGLFTACLFAIAGLVLFLTLKKKGRL